MLSYRCYFLDLRAAVAQCTIIEAESDDAACQHATALYRDAGAAFAGFELWDRARRVQCAPAAVLPI